jgi:hypothetical protein
MRRRKEGKCLIVICLCGLCAEGGAAQQGTPTSPGFPPPEHHRFSGDVDYIYDSASNRTTAKFSVSLQSYNIFHDFMNSGGPEVQTLTAEYSFPGRTLTSSPESVLVGFVRNEFGPFANENVPLIVGESTAVEILLDDSIRKRYRARVTQKRNQVRIYRGLGRPEDERGTVRWTADGSIFVGTGKPVDEIEVEECAEMWLPLQEFLSLMAARKVEGKVNSQNLRIRERAFFGLREFASHMNPATPASSK